METNSPHVTQLNRILLWWSEVLLNKRKLLFAFTMFNGRCIQTPYIPHKTHMDAAHVNTTTRVTLSLSRTSQFNGEIWKTWRLTGKEWSRQRQSKIIFCSKHSTRQWQFDTGLWNSKRVAGQIQNPTWNLGPQHVMSYPLVVLHLYIFRHINKQGCKVHLVFNLARFLGRIMQ